MFGIFPEKELLDADGELVQTAKIVIDDFSELIRLPLSYWTLKDYQSSWLSSLKQGLSTKTHAGLAVSMYAPEQINFIFAWVIYFQDEFAFVQNKVIFLDEKPFFTIEKINDFISSREIFSEDGDKISEWKTDLNSIIIFYDRLNKIL